MEVEAGIKLIMEYKAMAPYILQDLKDSLYSHPILIMKIHNRPLSTNDFVKEAKRKYWTALFNNSKFTGKMTSNLYYKYHNQVAELADYGFSEYNIQTIQIEMSKNLVKGIEDCIIGYLTNCHINMHTMMNSKIIIMDGKQTKHGISIKRSFCLT